jgi:vacuolar-type H+-ATPase subunit F/Vma7
VSIWVIGDRLMVDAFELVGVPGRVIAPGERAGDLAEQLARDRGARLILIHPAIRSGLRAREVERLARRFDCLVIDAPGVGEPPPDADALGRSLQRALGVRP